MQLIRFNIPLTVNAELLPLPPMKLTFWNVTLPVEDIVNSPLSDCIVLPFPLMFTFLLIVICVSSLFLV